MKSDSKKREDFFIRLNERLIRHIFTSRI